MLKELVRMDIFPLLELACGELILEKAFSKKSRLGGVTGVEHGTNGAALPTQSERLLKFIVVLLLLLAAIVCLEL